jgi:hypothetical protein
LFTEAGKACAEAAPPHDLFIKSDIDATYNIEFIVENVFIFILPGPIIVRDCLSISTSHILLGFGIDIPAIFVAID